MICAPDPNIIIMRGPNNYYDTISTMIRSQLRIKKIENIFKFKSNKYGGIDW